MNTRETATRWFESLPSREQNYASRHTKDRLADVYFNRSYLDLTGVQIEEIWRNEIGEDISNNENITNKDKMKNNKYLEQAKEVYQLATDLWYKHVSDKKRGGGHPGPMGNASNEEDDKIISLLGGAIGALKDVSQQKDNELEKALEWWGTIPNSYNSKDQVMPNRRQLLVKYFPEDGATRAIPSTDILTMYQGEMENQDPVKIKQKKLKIEELMRLKKKLKKKKREIKKLRSKFINSINRTM